MGEPLRYEYGDKTLLELVHLQSNKHLNLEPGFQRESVWHESDRRKLIHSILQGYPIPSIFLYRREEHGMPVYDVIDGKQRLETIFMFTRTRGFKKRSFDVRFQFDDDKEACWYNWAGLRRCQLAGRILSYKVQTVEVSGELSDIIDLFVRINSTGKALTSSEKRHARYYESRLLREAERLARRLRSYFVKERVLTAQQIDRMKDVELVSELLASVLNGGPIHKKAAVDRAVGNEAVNLKTLRKTVREFTAVARAIRRLFPDLHSTRFHNVSEFYSLFMVIWEMLQEGMVVSDRKRNRTAQALLMRLSNGVDKVRDLQRKAKGAERGQSLYADYLLSTQHATDNLAQRKRRAQILRALFSGLFERKDAKRLFSVEQRRLLWNSEEKKTCRSCKRPLDWTNFQVDHVTAHSRGGRTELLNAALLCRSCNASKGARGARRRAA